MDRFGRPVAHVAWKVTGADLDRISQTAQRLLAAWPGARQGFPSLVPRRLGLDGSKPHDAHHPVGTCSMGHGRQAVVDHDLKVWGVANLWVASTGVLPSAGTANPTFGMLCLCHRLAEQLAWPHFSADSTGRWC
jgi:choline dehydrogenase-like flavoprotein